jgi:hypothetical protein
VNESLRRSRGALSSLICGISAWLGVLFIALVMAVRPDIFNLGGHAAAPSLPLPLLMLPLILLTSLAWLAAVIVGGVSLIRIYSRGRPYRSLKMAWAAVGLTVLPIVLIVLEMIGSRIYELANDPAPPEFITMALHLWPIGALFGGLLLVFLVWRFVVR